MKIISNVPRFPLLFLALAAAWTTVAADPETPATAPEHGKEVLIVKDDKSDQTLDAKGQDVTVSGSRNKLTITGTCHALTVTGQLNFISVEAVASISLPGGGNEITYGKAVDGKKPEVTDTGKDNVVAAKKSE